MNGEFLTQASCLAARGTGEMVIYLINFIKNCNDIEGVQGVVYGVCGLLCVPGRRIFELRNTFKPDYRMQAETKYG